MTIASMSCVSTPASSSAAAPARLASAGAVSRKRRCRVSGSIRNASASEATASRRASMPFSPSRTARASARVRTLRRSNQSECRNASQQSSLVYREGGVAVPIPFKYTQVGVPPVAQGFRTSENFPEEVGDGRDLLGWNLVAGGVSVPLDRVAGSMQQVACQLALFEAHHRVGSAVPQEKWRFAIRLLPLSLQGRGDETVAGERDDRGQPLGKSWPGIERHRGALGKAAEDDAMERDTPRALASEEGADCRIRGADRCLVLPDLTVGVAQVIPTAHLLAITERDPPHRSVRQHESQRCARGARQWADERLELMPVRADAVQPDDGGGGLRACLDLYGLEQAPAQPTRSR